MRQNLVGDKYFLLTVLKEDHRNDKKVWYLCKCECGNIKIVSDSNLRNGSVKSCGCLKIKNRIKKAKELIGKKFNRLTVMEISNKKGKKNKTLYKCKCECGNIIEVDGYSLSSGHIVSCGCKNNENKNALGENNFKNLMGKKFGRLEVIKKTLGRDINGAVIWECECDCGTHIKESSNTLLMNKVQSCGCLKSKGEEKIAKILESYSINFKKQFTFDDLKYKRKLRFDFAVLDDNNNLLYLIEYDGIQHFSYSGNGWNNIKNFYANKTRDNLKNNYCKNNNIKLIRIPYTHFSDIVIDDLLISSNFIV